MQIATELIATALLLGQVAEVPPASAGDMAAIKAEVFLIDEVQVPARQAGVLMSLTLEDGTRIEPGTRVAKDMLLGKLDDRDARARQRAARYGWPAVTCKVMQVYRETLERATLRPAVTLRQCVEAGL